MLLNSTIFNAIHSKQYNEFLLFNTNRLTDFKIQNVRRFNTTLLKHRHLGNMALLSLQNNIGNANSMQIIDIKSNYQFIISPTQIAGNYFNHTAALNS